MKYILSFILLLLIYKFTFSQTKKELEKKKQENQEEINYLTKLFRETKKTKTTSLNDLIMLNKKIELREANIRILNKEINILNKQISAKVDSIKKLETDLQSLKNQYAQMLVYAYKNRNSYNRLMFIFSSNSFNQAYKRLKYLQQYSEYRIKQSELIVKNKSELEQKVNQLQKNKQQKLSLLKNKEDEKQLLVKEKEEQDKLIESLEKKQKELLAELKKKQKLAEELQKKLEKVISEEIRKAKEEAKKKGKDAFALTPEELKLSSEFKNNKSKLPWPTERGIILNSFGEHLHPVLAGIKTKNNGIDIQTNSGAKARAIFDGVVATIIIVPGENKAVIIKHGEYFTVYSNLTDVYVKKGDKVKTKQNIGLIYTDKTNSNTELHFEIWKNKTLLDPQDWLSKGR